MNDYAYKYKLIYKYFIHIICKLSLYYVLVYFQYYTENFFFNSVEVKNTFKLLIFYPNIYLKIFPKYFILGFSNLFEWCK